MARRSQRLSAGNGSASKHKRSASGPVISNSTIKRPKAHNSTPTKSQYFQRSDEGAERESDDEDDTLSNSEESGSDFGADGESAPAEEANTEDEDDNDASGSDDASTKQSQHAWRSGVKADLGPGKQLIIKKPKPRSAGKTPYTDETIHPNTLLFLADLKANNDRQWLKMHEADFRQSEKDWHSFVQHMTEKLMEIDDTIPELPVKDVIFRIYRDIRFSKDPTPYKAWFSVAWLVAYLEQLANGGTLNEIAPNRSFIGGGLWMPEAGPTAAMRRAIDRDSSRLKNVLSSDRIRKEFLDGCGKSGGAAVKNFVKSNRKNALKTKPKGYDADHADIDLLRLRNFTIGRDLSDEEVLGEAGMLRIAELLACLKPYITYINSVISPDEDDSDREVGDEDEDEDEGEDEEGGHGREEEADGSE